MSYTMYFTCYRIYCGCSFYHMWKYWNWWENTYWSHCAECSSGVYHCDRYLIRVVWGPSKTYRKSLSCKKSAKPCWFSLVKGLDIGLGPNSLTPSKKNYAPAAVSIDSLKVQNFSLHFNEPADNLEKHHMQQLKAVIQMPGISLDSITYRTRGHSTAASANPTSAGCGGQSQKQTLKGYGLGTKRFLWGNLSKDAGSFIVWNCF